jgi:hypothetical protein
VFLDIEDKQKNLIPLMPKYIQSRLLTDRTGRDVWVKPSQVGASSILIGDYLLDTIFVPGTVSVIISHEEFITQRLLNKANMYYKRLKDKIPTIPALYHDSDNLKTFPSIGSSFYIGSSRKYVFGRGETIHNLLCDEYAFWDPDAIRRIMAPAQERVPLNGRIDILSTPNGEENSFCEVYRNAKEGNEIGKSIYRAHFFPWFLHDEYRLTKDSPYCLPGDNTDNLDLTDEESLLMLNNNLVLDQIRWRRRKKTEMESLARNGETEMLFQQEYPEDDVSCFLTTGDMAYNPDLINEMAKRCHKPSAYKENVSIWFEPEKNLKYLVSCDVGISKVSETVITVWHFYDKDGITHAKHCASISGLIMPAPAAAIAKSLARYYNNALVTWDAASQGLAFGHEMLHCNQPYGNVYYREDVVSGKRSRVEGWLTTPNTKKYMHSEMSKILPNMETYDINVISQLKNMRWDGNVLSHVGLDDYHDSAAIAVCCRSSIPITRGYAGETGWKW